MNTLQAIIIAIIEGLTEYLPISSTAHMIFTSSYFGIQEDDFVVIMWSSSLRDIVPFLPKNEWVSWSVKHLVELPHKFIESYQSENEKYNNFLYSFKELFITDLFNQNYYNIWP